MLNEFLRSKKVCVVDPLLFYSVVTLKSNWRLAVSLECDLLKKCEIISQRTEYGIKILCKLEPGVVGLYSCVQG